MNTQLAVEWVERTLAGDPEGQRWTDLVDLARRTVVDDEGEPLHEVLQRRRQAVQNRLQVRARVVYSTYRKRWIERVPERATIAERATPRTIYTFDPDMGVRAGNGTIYAVGGLLTAIGRLERLERAFAKVFRGGAEDSKSVDDILDAIAAEDR